MFTLSKAADVKATGGLRLAVMVVTLDVAAVVHAHSPYVHNWTAYIGSALLSLQALVTVEPHDSVVPLYAELRYIAATPVKLGVRLARVYPVLAYVSTDSIRTTVIPLTIAWDVYAIVRSS